MTLRRGAVLVRGLLLGVVGLGAFLIGSNVSHVRSAVHRPPVRPAEVHTRPAPGEVSEPVHITFGDLPHSLGMAAEFAPQGALIIGAGEMVLQHEQLFVQFVSAAHEHAEVIALVNDEEQLMRGQELLCDSNLPEDAARFLVVPVESMWVRDFGPLFVQCSDGQVRIFDTVYAQDDGDEDSLDVDNDVPRALGTVMKLPVVRMKLRIEGGNLLNNGDGLCVTSTTPIGVNASHGLVDTGVAEELSQLGFRRWLYLRPLEGEPTGHVDMFVQFLAPNVVVVGQYDPSEDPVNAAICDEAAATLAREDTSAGPMQVHRIPMPAHSEENWRTYTNGVLLDGAALIPVYSGVDPNTEAEALAVYRKLLPGRKIVPINCDSVIPLGGALHCVSMNVPKFVPLTHLQHDLSDLAPGVRDLSRKPIPGLAGVR
ncbi:MAG: agmatine deiminase family protein [Phycisphaerae bacterium]